MIDWLIQPIDPTRAHAVGMLVSWHGRTMVLAWGIIVPLVIVITRYFKITPQQDWPTELDNIFWWRTHVWGHSMALVLTLVGLALIVSRGGGASSVHSKMGYLVLVFAGMQIISGLLRGKKGGPTDRDEGGAMAGDHYDMSPHRHRFETLHKTMGYASLIAASAAIILGLWAANAPGWMYVGLVLWWFLLGSLAFYWQKTGRAIDTYQAIWGPDPDLPGNKGPKPGWAMTRLPRDET